ncbi:MAG: SDR family NAD(P)-dependent oxidoreductase, partial [Anaerovoracaceae bacterium]
IITGATKGIGESAAKIFADEGAKVVICGRSESEGRRVADEINRDGQIRAAFFKLDVTDYKNWQEAFEFAKETFGKINILVNNAGISFYETVYDTVPENWDKTVATNQTGVYYGMQIGIKEMEKTGEDCAIVSTASVDGVVGDSYYFAYAATKAAVQAMTRCAAIYCGKNKLPIRVNAVAPGYILTPMAYDDAAQIGITIDEYCKESIERHPIGRMGTPEEIAKAYLYLACDDSSFVTGTTLIVDGGYTAQ